MSNNNNENNSTTGTGTDDHFKAVRHVRNLEEAVACIFQNNFDVDSKGCLLTLMKILDNVLQKPADAKVRCIRLENAAFQQKVGCRKGGIEFLLAAGFERIQPPPPLLSLSIASQSNQQQGMNGDAQLVLDMNKEDQSLLITARRLLAHRAVQDLGMKPEELPVFRPPPVVSFTASTSKTTTTSAASAATFNPYAGHRYDARSAAIGQNLGPDANYVSPTESQLQKLQQRQATLEKELHQEFKDDPAWKAFQPHQSVVVVAPAADDNNTTATTASKSDSGLLADKLKKQQLEQQKRDHGGFTTKAMRDLEKIKKQKVYRHVSLTVQFPDGYKLLGKFLPSTSIQQVKQSMQTVAFVETLTSTKFDLYVTPPRRLLLDNNTLQQEGLVPAAKIFVSWQGPPPSPPYLRTELFEQAPLTAAQIFPESKSVVPSAATIKTAQDDDDDSKPAATTKESREDALLRRMMGGTSNRTSTTSNPAAAATTSTAKAADKKPKWFKS